MFLPEIVGSIVESGALNTLCILWCTISLFIKYKKYAKIKETIFPLIGYFVSMPLFSKLALGVLSAYLKFLLGITLVGLSFYFIKYNGKIKIAATKKNGLIAGVVSGAFSGLFSIGGLPIIAYFINAHDDKNEYMGTVQFYFIFTCAYSTIVRVFLGVITKNTLILAIPGLVGLMVGMSLGAKIIKKLNVGEMRKASYYVTGICGVWMIIVFMFKTL
ncbi:hypothetical protein SDC9_182746 [bioreactor metagenome]|uniref:Uncharacterized protein n=1 Tax=bioreactor metagenome TaxID=1076179 RepID=A0A645HAU7_9ZZZZ